MFFSRDLNTFLLLLPPFFLIFFPFFFSLLLGNLMISFRLAFELRKELRVFSLEWVFLRFLSSCVIFFLFFLSFRTNNLTKMGKMIVGRHEEG